MNSQEAVVLQGTGGVWQVRTDAGETMDVSLKGRLKREPGRDARERDMQDRGGGRESMRRGVPSDDTAKPLKLTVGDRVTITTIPGESSWAIDAIHARRSQLARRSPGGARGERIMVANLDQVLVVFAAARPEPHPRMLDRFLVIAEANDLSARVVINKCELVDESSIRAHFADQIAAGYPLHLTSVVSGAGLEELRAEVEGRSSALTGPSGVGKSSLMNRLFPGLDLRTADISESVNKGRHTTVGAVLHPLPGGGFVADTPGLREVGLWNIAPEDLAACFPEFRPLLSTCRFADCLHTVEPGCAIRDAVQGGRVRHGRYESYLKLRAELVEGAADFW
ncbi:MAG: ribosome small subunit-dependent GTPase A [Gemmatimonadaceae bacterium]|nr:ribosome small subunit-dependent GTPase A [Gemmatimonadaceae bacterium]